MQSTLTSPLQSTFFVLAKRNSSASISVLEHGLRSALPEIRIASVQGLLARGGEEEIRALVRCIDLCTNEELPLLASHAALFLTPAETALADHDPETRQRGLIAIARLRLAPLFHHLIRVAESQDDPQQIIASELLSSLSSGFGAEARLHLTPPASSRDQWLSDLTSAVGRYSKHRVTEILDNWLVSSHWEDYGFKRLFASTNESGMTATLKRIRILHHPGIDELLVGTYWSKSIATGMLDALQERKPESLLSNLVSLERRFGVTGQLSKNLSSHKIPCLAEMQLSTIDPDRLNHGSLLRLLVDSEVSPDVVLSNVWQTLCQTGTRFENECAEAIRRLRTMKAEIVVMVLSDCFDMPDIDPYEPPPWKGALRESLDTLLSHFFELPAVVRAALKGMLSEFRCEDLFRFADTWPEAHVKAYGRISRLVDSQFLTFFEGEAQSQSHVKRAKAIRMIRHLGFDEALMEHAVEGLSDRHEAVRIQAVHAIAFGHDRENALELLLPLMVDQEQSVKAAVEQAVEKLKS
jgi:hypothetical protein